MTSQCFEYFIINTEHKERRQLFDNPLKHSTCLQRKEIQ